ncbi:MAG: response regulator, partial [Anaerolineales bacterium]
LAGNEVIGTLGLDITSPQIRLSPSDLALIETILVQASSAIQHAWLFKQIQDSREALKRQNEYLAAAAEIGRLVTSALDLKTIFSRAVNLVRERFGYYHAAIFVIEETGFNAILEEATGEAGAEMKRRGHFLPVGSKSIVGTVTASGEPLVVNDVSQNPIHRFNPLLPETRSEAAFPLRIGQRVIGALDVQSTQVNAFSEDDIRVLQILADQIAVAIDNARSYQIVQDAMREMREADRMKSQFLANMSHELRTPLNSIIGFSRVILKGIDGPITELQRQDLTAIYNSGQHLLGLINDILDLSKIEAGKMELAFEEVNLAEIINSVMSTAAGLVKDKPITLKRSIPENLPTVRADATRIRQVLLNLLSNAAKFTEQGEIRVEASVQTNANGQEEVLVKVSDTGPGISEEDQKRLFQPFSQVDTSLTRKTGGTGLGLAISAQLIQLHGGTIGVQSKIGEGSTFYFTVPVYQKEIMLSVDKPIILAIDDDPQVIALYERYLSPLGYQIIGLTEPRQAVEQALRLKPFAITLDIMMPGYDGWQVLTDLKSNPETRAIPVIICSIVEDQEKGFSMGAADYLVKPILEEDLIRALDRLNADGSIHDVLIIDDNANDLRLLEKTLREGGHYRPILAEGGEKGWNMLLQHRPHAVILDLFMPDLDGFTLLERMRTSAELRDIPVIVVSGVELTPEQQKQLQEFGQRLLQKGAISETELFSALERALRRVHNPQYRESHP